MYLITLIYIFIIRKIFVQTSRENLFLMSKFLDSIISNKICPTIPSYNPFKEQWYQGNPHCAQFSLDNDNLLNGKYCEWNKYQHEVSPPYRTTRFTMEASALSTLYGNDNNSPLTLNICQQIESMLLGILRK